MRPRQEKVIAALLLDSSAEADRIGDQLTAVRWAKVTVVRRATLADGLIHLASSACDLVVVDPLLPDATGLEVVRRVQRAAPSAACVVLSDRHDDATELAAVQLGAQDYLPKDGLHAATLSRVIRHAVERARLLAQIRALVMNDADATLVVSGDGTVKFVNLAAERLFGRSAEQLVGELFGFPIETTASSEIEVIGAAGPRQAEMRVVTTDWDGEPCYLLSLRDVTDRKRAAELQARLLHADRLASIGQLAAGVAHEINNPAAFVQANIARSQEDLTALEELVRTLRSGLSNASEIEAALLTSRADERLREMRELARENLHGIDRIVRIVRDLRSFSRIERDEIDLVDLNNVVEVACSMTLNEIRHRAQLVKDLGRIPPVAGDRGKLSQVFTNLIVNAAQAIQEGAADRNTIWVTTRHEMDNVIVTVRDTGGGIPKALQRHIFEPFFTTKPREIGTGLGLPLSAEIVRKHGGYISFKSEEGEGTTFTATIPVNGPMATALSLPLPEETPVLPRGIRACVLIIDDEPMLLNALRRMLEKDHDVVLAAGGAKGLELLAAGDANYDVILCDLMMPEVDGVALYAEMSKNSPHLLDRIVFCSGGAFTARAKALTSSIRNICLDKPISGALLLSVIDRVATAARVVQAAKPL